MSGFAVLTIGLHLFVGLSFLYMVRECGYTIAARTRLRWTAFGVCFTLLAGAMILGIIDSSFIYAAFVLALWWFRSRVFKIVNSLVRWTHVASGRKKSQFYPYSIYCASDMVGLNIVLGRFSREYPFCHENTLTQLWEIWDADGSVVWVLHHMSGSDHLLVEGTEVYVEKVDPSTGTLLVSIR